MNDKINGSINALIIQFHPIERDTKGNISKIEKLLEDYTDNDKIDILLFPEMALTGYIFDSVDDIKDYLEEYNKGTTFDFCSSLAKKLNCYVFLGYPEKCDEVLYNSCMIINRNGEALPSYRKHFLYEMDKTWCVEGKEFGTIDIQTRSGENVKFGIGICMDLNPYEFKAPWGAMEFSTFCKKKDVDVILFLTNWLDNQPNDESWESVMHIINYWAERLKPFLCKLKKKTYFLAANRCGKERDTTFIGCSCALELGAHPMVLKNLNKKEENTILVKLNL